MRDQGRETLIPELGVAAQPPDMSKTDYTPHGWAMEARLNAEDPLRNFLPSAGTLGSVSFPLKDSGASRRAWAGLKQQCWVGLSWAPVSHVQAASRAMRGKDCRALC